VKQAVAAFYRMKYRATLFQKTRKYEISKHDISTVESAKSPAGFIFSA